MDIVSHAASFLESYDFALMALLGNDHSQMHGVIDLIYDFE